MTGWPAGVPYPPGDELKRIMFELQPHTKLTPATEWARQWAVRLCRTTITEATTERVLVFGGGDLEDGRDIYFASGRHAYDLQLTRARIYKHPLLDEYYAVVLRLGWQ